MTRGSGRGIEGGGLARKVPPGSKARFRARSVCGLGRALFRSGLSAPGGRTGSSVVISFHATGDFPHEARLLTGGGIVNSAKNFSRAHGKMQRTWQATVERPHLVGRSRHTNRSPRCGATESFRTEDARDIRRCRRSGRRGRWPMAGAATSAGICCRCCDALAWPGLESASSFGTLPDEGT